MTLDLSPGERGRVNQAGAGSRGCLDRRNSPDEGGRGRGGTERRSMESRGGGHRGRIDEDEKGGDRVGADRCEHSGICFLMLTGESFFRDEADALQRATAFYWDSR